MSNYVNAFTTPMMLIGIAVVLVGSAVATWILRRRLASGLRRAEFFAFTASAAAVLLVTLFRDPPQRWCPTCLAPDWGVPRFLSGNLGTEGLLNVALFVPAAFFAVLLWRAPLRTVAIATLTSAAIEVIQPMIGVGVNDLTDLATNITGAIVGATAAATIVWIAQVASRHRPPLTRTFATAAWVVVTLLITIGVPNWLADQRQAAAHGRLEQLFTATTLTDYRMHADTDWLATRTAFFAQTGGPVEESYATDTVARHRYRWSTYTATRCVIAEWTTTGFTATDGSGDACRTPFHS